MSKDAPSNAGELADERDSEDVVMQPLLGRSSPVPIAATIAWR